MNRCEIIVNFDKNQIKTLEENFKLQNFLLVSDDIEIIQTLRSSGYNAEWINEPMEFANNRSFSIYETAINNMDEIRNFLNNITCEGTSIIEAFKSD